MASLGRNLAELMKAQDQQQQQQPMMPQPMMQQPGMMPMMPQEQMMPVQFDPYGQQQSGLAQALMRGIGYGRP